MYIFKKNLRLCITGSKLAEICNISPFAITGRIQKIAMKSFAYDYEPEYHAVRKIRSLKSVQTTRTVIDLDNFWQGSCVHVGETRLCLQVKIYCAKLTVHQSSSSIKKSAKIADFFFDILSS